MTWLRWIDGRFRGGSAHANISLWCPVRRFLPGWTGWSHWMQSMRGISMRWRRWGALEGCWLRHSQAIVTNLNLHGWLSKHPILMTHLTTFKPCARITSVFCSPLVPWDNSTREEQALNERQKSKTRALEVAQPGNGSGVRPARHVKGVTMSQYLLHIFSLSSSIKAGRYFYHIHSWSRSQMLMLLKKKFWISSSFPHWYCPWIIYCFISDLFSISFMNK